MVIGFVLATVPASAQTPPPETDAASQLEESVRVRLVQMAVLARGRGDRPLTDLTAEEVKVKQDGRRMRVAFLTPFQAEPGEESLPDVRLYVGVPGVPETTVRSASPGLRYLIVFVDVENDYGLLREQAAEDVARFVRERLGPGDRAAVFAYDGGIHLESEFTSSGEELAAAELREAARAVYGSTEQLAMLQLEVGTGEGARVRMDRLLRRAVDSRVTLHFVDRNPEPTGGFGARQGEAFQPGARPMQVAFRAAQDDSEEIAASTGGVFVPDTDVFSGLERAMELERGAYLLGYYLSHTPTAGC